VHLKRRHNHASLEFHKAWYLDCILSHRLTTDFILALDLDEFIVFANQLDSRRGELLEFLESQPPNIGAVSMSRITMTALKEDRDRWMRRDSFLDDILLQEAFP
jgi:hypothetical protein